MSGTGDRGEVRTYENPPAKPKDHPPFHGRPGFIDLCRGPHVEDTGRHLGHFKLMRVAGAYWRGDEHNPQLQRIYGTAWDSRKALEAHLHHLEEAARRDHRKLGAELDLFHFPPEVGSGLPLYHPKGGLVRKLMEDYSRAEHEKAGYEFVYTPHIAKGDLFEISGHLEWYADSMYPPMELDEGHKYYPKPMNCPMHMLIFRSQQRSYRELPLRHVRVRHGVPLREVGRGARPAAGPGLHPGRLAHLLHARPARGRADQPARVRAAPAARLRVRRVRGRAVDPARQVRGRARRLGRGGGGAAVGRRGRRGCPTWSPRARAFYAPKIDVHVRDAIGRRWQLSTLQVDFQEPRRFDLEYVGADNQRHQPKSSTGRCSARSTGSSGCCSSTPPVRCRPGWRRCRSRSCRCAPTTRTTHAGSVERLRAEGFRAEVTEADEPLGARIRRPSSRRSPTSWWATTTWPTTRWATTRGAARSSGTCRWPTFLERLRTEVATHA